MNSFPAGVNIGNAVPVHVFRFFFSKNHDQKRSKADSQFGQGISG